MVADHVHRHAFGLHRRRNSWRPLLNHSSLLDLHLLVDLSLARLNLVGVVLNVHGHSCRPSEPHIVSVLDCQPLYSAVLVIYELLLLARRHQVVVFFRAPE